MYTRPYELYISLDDLKTIWVPKSDWPNERVIRAGGSALELTFLLCQSLETDPRSTLRREARRHQLEASLITQFNLLDTLLAAAPLPPHLALQDAPTTNLTAFPRVASWSISVRRWSAVYQALQERLPFDLGLQAPVRALRHVHGLPTNGQASTLPRVPYAQWVGPAKLKALYHRRTFNAEDPFFCTVHQITECWFTLLLDQLDRAFQQAVRQAYVAAAHFVHVANTILDFLNKHIMLLETMVLADYHRLRVQLRDASGAQSMQAYEVIGKAQKLAGLIEQDAETQGLSLYQIQRTPANHIEAYHFVEALSSLGTQVSGFFFRHYKLASRVLGIESLGSLGFEVQALVNRFAKPFFQSFDEAAYLHAVVTNFQYGKQAGIMVSQLETADGMPNLNALEAQPGVTPAPVDCALMDKQVSRYFKAIRETNLEGWIKLFEPEGWIADPSGCRPYKGYNGLRIFFKNFIKVFSQELALVVRRKEIDADQGTVRIEWTVQAEHKGVALSFSGTEMLQFAPNGRILFVRVFHDPAVIARQFEHGVAHHAVKARTA